MGFAGITDESTATVLENMAKQVKSGLGYGDITVSVYGFCIYLCQLVYYYVLYTLNRSNTIQSDTSPFHI